MGTTYRLPILAFILLTLPLLLLEAAGAREDPIALARQLIIEKRYNEALAVLAEAARKDPERIEEVEKLIQRIRVIRGEYNDKYEELIKVLYEEKNVEKALKIIRELEALDAAPNENTRVALQKAKVSAQFVYYQNQFNELMARAFRELEQKEYAKAIELYVSGFTIGRDFFLESKYGNIVEGRVLGALEGVEKASEEFLRLRTQFDPLSKDLLQLIKTGTIEGVATAVEPFLEAFSRAAALYKTTAEATEVLKDQNERIVQARRLPNEDFYLGFMQRIVGGRSTSATPDGIRGAVEMFLKQEVFPVLASLTEWMKESYRRGVIAYDQSQGREAVSAFVQVQRIRDISRRVEGVYLTALPLFGGKPVPAYWELVKDYLPLWIDQIARARGGKVYQDMVEEFASLRPSLESLPSQRPELETLRASLRQNRAWTQKEREEWENFQAETLTNSYKSPEIPEILAQLTSHITERLSYLDQKEVDLVDRLAGIDLRSVEEKHQRVVARYRQATDWVEGTRERVQVAEGQVEELTVKYPNRALTLIEELTPEARSVLEEVVGYLAVYRGEIPKALSDPRVVQKIARAEGMQGSLQREILPGMVSLAAKARENILLAERYRNEGNLRVQEVQAAVAQNRFEQARESLGAARQRFSLSLSFQEDPQFRKESDALLLSLNDSITDAENKLVIAEVRRLINEAKRLYYLNAFEDSESVLLRAQTRWRATQAEDNPEVTYWLGFVRAALFVKSSRELLPTDPLYIEMSQLLSLARKDFENGRTLLDRGNRREALDAFAAAEEKIRTVLIAFPFNQQASVLALRIAQLKDREGFATLFRTKFREAVAKVNTNPQEAYIDLKDLEQIDPNFAGLKDAIYNLEIKLGIRIPPPDPKALAESEELYRAALRIVTGNVRAQFPIALEQLNRAIQLNPDNARAIELKDRLQIETGGQTSVVLSSVAEEQYRLAERRYIEGNYFEALSIVQRLLQNRESRNYPPLLELKRRIESRI